MTEMELVLRSGEFARIRRVTVADMVLSYSDNPLLSLIVTAARVTTFDGVTLTVEEFCNRDAEEMMPVVEAVSAMMRRIIGNRVGVA